MDLVQLIEDYIIWHRVSGHSKNTIALYRWSLGRFVAWLVANARPTSIDVVMVGDVRGFLQYEQQRDSLVKPKADTHSRTDKLSDRSVHVHARSIRAFYNWLVAEEYLSRSPITKLRPPKLEQKYKDVLSLNEVEQLFSAINPKTFLGSRMYAVVALLYDSGLRAGELTGLNLGDVNWSGYHVCVMGKGRKERLVPFSAATHRALRKYLRQRDRFAVENEEALFITSEGKRLTRDALTHAIKRLGRSTGIPRLHPHLLRHSAAVASVMNGADQFALKRILGHSQLSTTDQYVDYAQQHLAERHRLFSPMSKINERSVGGRQAKTSRVKKRRSK